MKQKYLGITPYDENDGFAFAGRTEETWALYDRIVRNDYTVYYAASGEGKSSLIRAGLLPILRRRDYFPIYIVFDDKEFNDNTLSEKSFEDVINHRIQIETKKYNVSFEQSEWSKSRFDEEQSEVLKTCFWWKLRNYCFKQGEKELKPLYIFDQFEEVFTKASYKWTDLFFTWLEEISTDYVPNSLQEEIKKKNEEIKKKIIEVPTQKNFKALFSFRTEYLGDLDYWCVQKHFLPSLQENRMCLKPLTLKGAREVIRINESSLGSCADKILQGCSGTSYQKEDLEQPCVYALILSVVCQTLSETSDKERTELLKKLNEDQNKTIDEVLLQFYKSKLQEAGLDYVKDEKIIANIEDALVDEKGKRNRRDTNETSMLPLAEWIELLSDKKNGLIKVIGRKEVDGKIIKTVEFPHDRLCKAIDSSRKERQERIVWKLKRQAEWIQFGIISITIGIIAFLWNALMPALKPLISNIISGKFYELAKQFKVYLQHESSKLGEYSLDESFSTLSLMILLLLLVPLITTFIIRKQKKWQQAAFILSTLSTTSFIGLMLRNTNIHFTNNYVSIFTTLGFFASLVGMFVSASKLKPLHIQKSIDTTNNEKPSYWPLWGGYFFFAAYVFYETLFRITFGINEPEDSCWALFVLPMLYVMWAWGFFSIGIEKQMQKRILVLFLSMAISLTLLSIISYIPFHNKRSYGMMVSLFLILLSTYLGIYIVWKSKSQYYSFSNVKRILVGVMGFLVLLTTYTLNLGFNPFTINPTNVSHVCSWRTVTLLKEDSLKNKKLGIVYASTGINIIPFYMPYDEETDSLLSEGISTGNGYATIENTLTQPPLINNNITDNSLRWDSTSHHITADIPINPTLEQYLYKTRTKGLFKNCNLTDSINYYAAELFYELRNANIKFVITGKSYDLEALNALNILDSLQHKALDRRLKWFSPTAIDTSNSQRGHFKRNRIHALEDKHLIDFHRELCRTFLLCLIRDRTSQSDMPAMFNIASIYLPAFFAFVPKMSVILSPSHNITLNTNNGLEPVLQQLKCTIYAEDLLNGKLFAWYDLFNHLCLMDIGWNAETFQEKASNDTQKIAQIVQESNQILRDLLADLTEATGSLDDFTLNGKNSNDKLTSLKKYVENKAKLTDKKYYDDLLNRLENINLEAEITKRTIDRSFKALKDSVITTLLPIMENRYDGIYNNDFENVCKNLILVTTFRGCDAKDDINLLTKYLKEKDSFYNIIKVFIQSIDTIIQSNREANERVDEMITLINNRVFRNLE